MQKDFSVVSDVVQTVAALCAIFVCAWQGVKHIRTFLKKRKEGRFGVEVPGDDDDDYGGRSRRDVWRGLFFCRDF